MTNQSLVEYIKKYSSQYSKEYLRSYLIGQGYSVSDVDQAFSVAIGKTQFDLKKVAIILGVVIVLLLIIYVSVDFVSRSELKINLLVTVEPEIELDTSQALTVTIYSTSVEDINGVINVTVLDPQKKEVFSRDFLISFDKEKEFAVELNFGKGSSLGKYTAKISLNAEKMRLEKEAFFVVKEKSVERPKPITTQIPISKCVISCDDLDPCTVDACINGVCVSEKKTTCCGNNVCEDSLGETVLNCPNDCRVQKTKTIFEIKQEAMSLAKSNPDSAATTCLQLSDPDFCIYELYETTRNRDFCRAILDSSVQSNCYLDYALRNNDFGSCNLIKEEYSQRNCFSMKQLEEMRVRNS